MKRGNLLRRLGALIACAVLVVGATAVSASETSALAAGPSTLDLEQAAGYTWEEPDADWLDDELLLEAMDAAEDEDSSSAVTDENETTDATDAEDGNGTADVTEPPSAAAASVSATRASEIGEVKAVLRAKLSITMKKIEKMQDLAGTYTRELNTAKWKQRRRTRSGRKPSRSLERKIKLYESLWSKNSRSLLSAEARGNKIRRALQCISEPCVVSQILK